MTQSDFARKIDRAPGRVSEWVRGKRIPDPISCDLIADALAIDLDKVLVIAGHRPATEPINFDDPSAILIDLVKRVDWEHSGQFKVIAAALRALVEESRH